MASKTSVWIFHYLHSEQVAFLAEPWLWQAPGHLGRAPLLLHIPLPLGLSGRANRASVWKPDLQILAEYRSFGALHIHSGRINKTWSTPQQLQLGAAAHFVRWNYAAVSTKQIFRSIQDMLFQIFADIPKEKLNNIRVKAVKLFSSFFTKERFRRSCGCDYM